MKLSIFYACILYLFATSHASTFPLKLGSEAEITLTNLGLNYTFSDDQPYLNFNSVFELCKSGVWITFSEENYGYPGGSGGIQIHYIVDESCDEPVDPTIRSVRFAGNRSNYSAKSVTLFSLRSFAGASQVFEESISEIKIETHSLVSIYANVELFQKANFEGESVCIVAGCEDRSCWRWSISSDYPWTNAARSARAGCSLLR